MKRGILAIISSVTLLGILVGCAPSATPAPTSQATAKPAATAAATASAKSATTAATPAAKASPQSFGKVKISVPSGSTYFLGDFFAKEKDIFQDEGLDAEVVIVQGALGAPGLLSGELDYIDNMSGALQASLLGEPLRVVVVPTAKTSWHIILAPGLTSAEQIKGKAVAITSKGGAAQYAAEQGLKKLGLDPANDVTLVPIGGGVDQIAALKNGAVAAASMAPPFDIMARGEGLKELLNTAEVAPVATNGIATTQKKLKENPGQVKAVIRAYLRTNAYIRDHTDEAVQFAMTRFKLEKDVAEGVLAGHLKEYSFDGTVPDGTLPHVLEMITFGESKTKNATLEQVKNGFDLGLLKEAQKELGLSR